MIKKYKSTAINKCFEAYFEMGESRSLFELEKLSGVDYKTLSDWSNAYGWEEKIQERQKEIDRTFEEGYKRRTRDIRDSLVSKMEELISQMNNSSLGLPFSINNVTDLKALAQSYESLTRASVLANSAKAQINSQHEAPKSWSDLLTYEDNGE